MSEPTTKQAATIEETSASIEDLSATVVDNAGKAELASRQAGDTARTAEEGGVVMARAVDVFKLGKMQSGPLQRAA